NCVYGIAPSLSCSLSLLNFAIRRSPTGTLFSHSCRRSNEEEWVYILSGRGIAEIGDVECEVGPGDFMGFGLPQQPHHLRNPFNEDLVYLIGGEAGRLDVGVFPRLGKRVIRDGESAYIFDESALQLFWSSKQSTED
ncbi:cupin domain-containing protein, partial [Trichocoleus sp. DQ-U1]|uniref:cupin domain-containing protein n=1 Tax=Trichocoleus sp. DQ-U1 TaxID=2933926 RepID=UPI0032990719